jgi:hypothetical protein
MYWPRIGFAAFFLAAVLSAQQPAAPRFDVVSIRAVPPNAPTVMRDFEFTPVLPGGQYVDSRAWLPLMIAFAYDMKNLNLDEQLVGLPNWAKNQIYEVAAKPAEGFPALSPAENVQQVLQNQFGLHLASATGPVEYWVVDHIEPPTDN